MLKKLSYEDIELMCGLIAVVAFFIAIVVNGIVIAIKEGKKIRKLEKQEKNDYISEK